METDDTIVTWCVGHLVSMSYPDAYDPSLKRWSMNTIPFIPGRYRYQVIDGVKKQFGIVAPGLDRLADPGRDPARDPRGKTLLRLR